jgi:peptidoglycan/LPS O-acetylase OafA/YrhL
VNVQPIASRRILLAGAILGAAVGGSLATVSNGKSGPRFWAGLAVGAIIGVVFLVAVVALFQLAQSLRRRTMHRT